MTRTWRGSPWRGGEETSSRSEAEGKGEGGCVYERKDWTIASDCEPMPDDENAPDVREMPAPGCKSSVSLCGRCKSSIHPPTSPLSCHHHWGSCRHDEHNLKWASSKASRTTRKNGEERNAHDASRGSTGVVGCKAHDLGGASATSHTAHSTHNTYLSRPPLVGKEAVVCASSQRPERRR